ncbi:hypothetical protein [Desulfamplus magnetovallimortis]|uniref:hypothetical protein n=1 Tax=Desulfamplus magnetovallimortis TaxID=1246637 RepID=UPI001118378F|nr:hypothetical protein [Desulfamplus magnetovallimortis]
MLIWLVTFCIVTPHEAISQSSDTVTEGVTQSDEGKMMSQSGDMAEPDTPFSVKNNSVPWDNPDSSSEDWPAVWKRERHIINPHWINPEDRSRLKQENSSLQGTLSPLSDSPREVIPVNPPYSLYYPLMESVGYIKPDAVEPWGRVLKRKPGFNKDIKAGKDVYLDMYNEDVLAIGDRFYLLRTIDIMGATNYPVPGIQHYMTGVVEITKLRQKPCRCNDQRSGIEGKVITAYREIMPNDILIPYNSKDAKVRVKRSSPEIAGSILFAENHTSIIGENSVVFVNRGKIHGLNTGQYYDIFNRPEESEYPSPEYVQKTEYLGSCVVLSVEEETSAALITYAFKSINPGDLFFPPL